MIGRDVKVPRSESGREMVRMKGKRVRGARGKKADNGISRVCLL